MPELTSFPRRIVLSGSTSAGKSTLGRRLSALSGAPYIELDALFWEPKWTPAAPETFRARVAEAVAAPVWIIDGNYSVVRDLTWASADHLIWLDFSFPRIIARLTRRTLSRRMRNELLWGTNRESLRGMFLSGDSLYLWAVKTHWKHRRTYPEQFAQHGVPSVARVRSPRDLERHVDELTRLLRETERHPAG